MPSPHPAVTPASIIIAKKYGKSVSKGIVAMQDCIEILEKANKEKARDIKNLQMCLGKTYCLRGMPGTHRGTGTESIRPQ